MTTALSRPSPGRSYAQVQEEQTGEREEPPAHEGEGAISNLLTHTNIPTHTDRPGDVRLIMFMLIFVFIIHNV